MPMFHMPSDCGIGMTVRLEAVSAPAPGVTVLVTNRPGPLAKTSICSVAVKVLAGAVRLSVKFIAAVVLVREKFLVMILVEVACRGVGWLSPKNVVVVPTGEMNGSVKSANWLPPPKLFCRNWLPIGIPRNW